MIGKQQYNENRDKKCSDLNNNNNNNNNKNEAVMDLAGLVDMDDVKDDTLKSELFGIIDCDIVCVHSQDIADNKYKYWKYTDNCLLYRIGNNKFSPEPINVRPIDKKTVRQMLPVYDSEQCTDEQMALIIEGALSRCGITTNPRILLPHGRGNLVYIVDYDDVPHGVGCTLHGKDENVSNWSQYDVLSMNQVVDKQSISQFEQNHIKCINDQLHQQRPHLILKWKVNLNGQFELDFMQNVKQFYQNFSFDEEKINQDEMQLTLIKYEINLVLRDVLNVNEYEQLKDKRKNDYEKRGLVVDKMIYNLIQNNKIDVLNLIFDEKSPNVGENNTFYETFDVALCPDCYDKYGINGGCKHQNATKDKKYQFLRYYEGFKSCWCGIELPSFMYFGKNIGFAVNIGYNRYLICNCEKECENIRKIRKDMTAYINDSKYNKQNPTDILQFIESNWEAVSDGDTKPFYYSVLPSDHSHLVDIYETDFKNGKLIKKFIFCKIDSKLHKIGPNLSDNQVKKLFKDKHDPCRLRLVSKYLDISVGNNDGAEIFNKFTTQ